jgi:27-O-demethylrifamycin SV methyltransferase
MVEDATLSRARESGIVPVRGADPLPARTEEGAVGGMESAGAHEPAAHYDHVHSAWRLIMGEEFHYGYFVTHRTPLPQATAALTQLMLDRARIEVGDRVLDIGCGTGHQSCELAATRGAHVLGITTSASGVQAATALAADRQLADRGSDRANGSDGASAAGSARFEQRDGTKTGLPDASFDVVWVLESSHLMRERTALLTECARVLVPGGRLVLCDIMRKREIPFHEVRGRREDFGVLRAAFGDAHMEPLESYASTVRTLGLTVTEGTDISAETLPTLSAWRANVEAHRPAVQQLLGKRGADDFVRATEILEDFWQDQTLGYGILAAAKPR